LFFQQYFFLTKTGKLRADVLVKGEDDGLPEKDLGSLVAGDSTGARVVAMEMGRGCALRGLAVLLPLGGMGEEGADRDPVEEEKVFRLSAGINLLVRKPDRDPLFPKGGEELFKEF
jgi:hypothetical protein